MLSNITILISFNTYSLWTNESNISYLFEIYYITGPWNQWLIQLLRTEKLVQKVFFSGIMIIRGLKAHAITEWHPILSTLHTTLVQKTYCMSEGCDIFRNKTVLSWMSQCTISNHFISKSELTLEFEILPENFQWKHNFFWDFYFKKRVRTTKLFESPLTDSKKYSLHSNCEVRLWFISVCQFENNKVTDTANNLTSKHPQVSENDFAKEMTLQNSLHIGDKWS